MSSAAQRSSAPSQERIEALQRLGSYITRGGGAWMMGTPMWAASGPRSYITGPDMIVRVGRAERTYACWLSLHAHAMDAGAKQSAHEWSRGKWDMGGVVIYERGADEYVCELVTMERRDMPRTAGWSEFFYGVGV